MEGDFNPASANGGRQTVDADGGCLLAYSIAPQQKATNARRRPALVGLWKHSVGSVKLVFTTASEPVVRTQAMDHCDML